MFEAALYLLDLEIFHRTNRTLSAATWRRHGAWPEVDGFAEALDGLIAAGELLWGMDGIRWTGSGPSAASPAVRDGLSLVVDLVVRCDRAGLVTIVGHTSPFIATEETPYGAPLLFERNPQAASRSPGGSAVEQATFKQSELARVADLIERSLKEA